MAKNRFPTHPKQQTPVMSPSHPHTVGTAANPLSAGDDDDDICPVCDGQCTCDNKPRPRLPPSVNDGTGNVPHAAFTSTSSHLSPAPTLRSQSLKIKLTIPSSMLVNRRAPQSSPKKSQNAGETMSAFGNDGEPASSPVSAPSKPLQPQPSTSHGLQNLSVPKRRGRPPKALIAARELAAKAAAESHAAATLASQAISPQLSPRSHKRKDISLLNSGKRTAKSTTTRLTAKAKDKGTAVKKATVPAKRRRIVLSESSDLSDVEHHDLDDDDAQSVEFPTFVSASAMSCTSSIESDLTSLSDFDTDSSVQAEEETYILAEERRAHDKARVRRELLGEESVQKRRDPHNNWVIRPRKMSVGPSDVEMDVDSEVSGEEEEDDDEEEEEGEGDGDETDDRAHSVGYVGVATGWSEDDESSFDADLFFANLSDSEADNALSSSGDEGGDDGDQSDLETMSIGDATTASFIPHLLQDVENLPFEITQGWDGQVVFTNGLQEGQGILDMDFEVNAAQFVVETSASPSQESDVDMFTSDADEAGYAEDGDEGSGETTDEELVGDDDLPNERAMQIFNLPFCVSSINPMSTMSPAVSPHSLNRRAFGTQSHLDSPKPSDILAGKVFWEDSDDPDDFDDDTFKACSVSSSRGGLPRKGNFETAGDCHQVIIDDSHTDIPSPHPRFRRGRGKSASHLGRHDGVNHLLCRRIISRHASLPASSRSSFQLLSSEETGSTSPKLPPAEPIDLDDVLNASFLDSDPSDPQGLLTSTPDEDDSRKHLKNLSRWDLISVGAFRQTREAAGISDPGWGSDTPGAPAEYMNMMKSSPLSTMLWQNKSSSPPKQSRNMSVVISPVLLPVRDHDGDRTPTNAPPNYIPPPQQNHHYPHKTRKELRRERKLKRKSYSSVQHQHQHHQHHYHQHHPNSKTRSSSSSQRTNFFNTSSSVPALNL